MFIAILLACLYATSNTNINRNVVFRSANMLCNTIRFFSLFILRCRNGYATANDLPKQTVYFFYRCARIITRKKMFFSSFLSVECHFKKLVAHDTWEFNLFKLNFDYVGQNRIETRSHWRREVQCTHKAYDKLLDFLLTIFHLVCILGALALQIWGVSTPNKLTGAHKKYI